MVSHSFRMAIPPREANVNQTVLRGTRLSPVTWQPLPRLRGPDTRGAETRGVHESSHSGCLFPPTFVLRAPCSALLLCLVGARWALHAMMRCEESSPPSTPLYSARLVPAGWGRTVARRPRPPAPPTLFALPSAALPAAFNALLAARLRQKW